MLLGLTRTHRIVAAAFAATVALAATASAAHPKGSKRYGGFDSLPAIGKFRAPVSFKTNHGGTRLLAFTYSTLGCFGAGGFGKSDPYTARFSLHNVGTIKVSKSGKFSVSGAESVFKNKFADLITISSVSGRFTTSNAASGTITFKQKSVPKHGKSATCTGNPITFTATLK